MPRKSAKFDREFVQERAPVDFVTPTGLKVQLFSIGTLAWFLGRSPQTIRQWEIGGIIPKTPFKNARGARLYTQEQIDAIVKYAEKSKIKTGSRICETKFTENTFKAFRELNIKYLGKNAVE